MKNTIWEKMSISAFQSWSGLKKFHQHRSKIFPYECNPLSGTSFLCDLSYQTTFGIFLRSIAILNKQVIETTKDNRLF